MRKTRIAIMIQTISSGGAEKVAADMSIYFQQRGFEVFIFVEYMQKLKDYPHGGKLICVERKVSVKSGYSSREMLFGVIQQANIYRDLKRKYKIDITISFLQLSNLLNIISRDRDKVVVTLHSVMSYRTDQYRVLGYGKKIFRYLYQLADKIVLVSDFCQKDWMEHYGDLLSKTIVIQNPINILSISSDMRLAQKKQNQCANIVISVARLEGVKQQWHLIRAFQRVLRVCSDAQLWIAGDGILRNALEDLSMQLGMSDHIHFLGFVNDIGKYLQMAKVLAVTSASESWCNAIAEAMMLGVPVVTNDCPGGIRELMGVNERPKYKKHNLITECGIITPHLDGKKYVAEPLTREERLLADGLLRVLKDDKLRNEMGKKCIENAKKYTLDNIGEKWIRDVISKEDKKYKKRILGKAIEGVCTALAFTCCGKIGKKGCMTENVSGNTEIYNEKFVSYFNILERWMQLKEEGKGIDNFFSDYNYEKIVIYGMAHMGNHLVRELENSSVKIVCGIDRRAVMIYGKFPVITLNENIPDADVVIVTPVFDFENIKESLKGKVKCPIISLEDVIYYNLV